MYCSDHITYQLSPLNLYSAVVGMTWSLRLGSPQNGRAVLYLFRRHSMFQSLWMFLKQKWFGGICAVNPLSPACHVNPTLITYTVKICDIWHLQNLGVAGYLNITGIGTSYLTCIFMYPATSWTHLKHSICLLLSCPIIHATVYIPFFITTYIATYLHD
jgi:hypothetical protein